MAVITGRKIELSLPEYRQLEDWSVARAKKAPGALPSYYFGGIGGRWCASMYFGIENYNPMEKLLPHFLPSANVMTRLEKHVRSEIHFFDNDLEEITSDILIVMSYKNLYTRTFFYHGYISLKDIYAHQEKGPGPLVRKRYRVIRTARLSTGIPPEEFVTVAQ